MERKKMRTENRGKEEGKVIRACLTCVVVMVVCKVVVSTVSIVKMG